MQSYSTGPGGGGGPVSYSTAGTGYSYNNNPRSAPPQSNTTMSYSAQVPQRTASQQQQQDLRYGDPRKPDSYSFGVTAERQEEPLREEKMYSEDDEWQPSAMTLCFLAWIVICVAGGVGVGIYFANDRRGKNRPTVGPTLAPSAGPSASPSTVPVCLLCGGDDADEGAVVTNPNFVVTVPWAGGATTCRGLDLNGQQGLIPVDVCTEEVQIPSIQNSCGCMAPPNEAPADGSPAPNFVCNICGTSGDGGAVGEVTNPEGVIQVAGYSGTCANLTTAGEAGQISQQQCAALQPLAVDPCQCVFSGDAL